MSRNLFQNLFIGATLIVTSLAVSMPSYAADVACHSETEIVPVLIQRVVPRYPRSLLENGTEGFAEMMFDITEEGAVENIEIISAEPSYSFGREGRHALRQFQYEHPLDENGMAARICSVRFNFEFLMAPRNNWAR